MEADADAVGEDPALAELAEQQRKAALALLAKVDNLDSALVKLGEADFYGLAALEVCGSWETRMRWEPIEPWHLYQPLPNGPVFYNEQADTIPQRAEELERESVIIRTAPAMHLLVMFLISRMSHSEEQWDAFIDTYGLPNIFFELPAAIDERRALELDAVVKRLTGDGRGTMPNGTKIQTVETQQRDGTLFEQRGKWCRDAIISLVLGGTLTMETAPNSGTLAGNAHADSFAELCEGSAAGIGAAVDEQFLRPLLRKLFPNQPILVNFSYRPVDAEDAQQVAQTLATLKTAGWQVSPETASEMLGFEVEAAPEPQQPAAPYGMPFGNTAPAAGVVTNAADTPAEEAPLTKDELDALTLVQNAMDPDVLRQKAAAIAGRLYDAMQTGKQSETAPAADIVANEGPGGKDCRAKSAKTCRCPEVTEARDLFIGAFDASKGERLTAPGFSDGLPIDKDFKREVRSTPRIQDTQRALRQAGIQDRDEQTRIHFELAAKFRELIAAAPEPELKPVTDGKEKEREAAWHYRVPVDIPGATKPLDADFSVIKKKKAKEPALYSFYLRLGKRKAPAPESSTE